MKGEILSKPFVVGAAALAVASGLGGYVWREEHRPPVLEIYVFSMSSGFSMFIRTPDDKRVLIDGGSNSEVVRHLSKILPFYSRYIDMIVNTVPDYKHVSGLISVIDRYKVERVLGVSSFDFSSSTDPAYMVYKDLIEDKGLEMKEAWSGDSISLGSVVLDFVFPLPPGKFEYSKASAPEVLFSISHGSKKFFYLGDATTKVQRALITSDADILIVPHSAGPDSLLPALMNTLSPDHLVYSRSITREPASKNKKTDPLYFLLEEDRFNVKKGTVKIVSDGDKVTLFTL